MKATITNIAKLAGVSHGTVSRVLNGAPIRISSARKHKILTIARELNYAPNRCARSLKTGKHYVIAVIAYDITDAFAVECVSAMEAYLETTAYHAQWISCKHAAGRGKADPVQMLHEIAQFADGMIIIEANHLLKDADVLRFWAATDMPIMTVIRKVPGDMISSVTIDDELGTTLLLQHLMDERHTQIAFCYQKHKYPTAAIRHEVYGKLMERCGVKLRRELQVPVDGSAIDGHRAGEAILRLVDRPSAIIGFNDLTAIGLIRACYDHNLDVPREISIAGFDNIRISELTTPSLTTMAANYHEIARWSIEQLIRQIERPGDGSPKVHFVTKPKLIIRESTTRRHR